MTVYVFYNNDPLANDQGGGAEHLRCIYRALKKSDLEYKIIGTKVGDSASTTDVEYISIGPNILKFFLRTFWYFIKNRSGFKPDDVFHFHRNYMIWPKYIILGTKGKTILTYHNLTGEKLKDWFNPFFTSVARNIMLKFERAAVKKADRIIFVSDRTRKALTQLVFDNNLDKTTVIPAAFDSKAFSNCSMPSSNLSKKIIAVGRLSSIKNFELAIDTIEWLKNNGEIYTLTIVGDGEYRTTIEKHLAKSSCADQVTLYGLAEHSKVKGLIESNGIVLITSKHEASPTVVKEGIASFRPVVTTDVGDVNLWIKNGVNGFVVDNSPESLGKAIQKSKNLIRDSKYQQSISLDDFSEYSIMNKLLAEY